MVSNEPYRYSSYVTEPTPDLRPVAVCTLDGCDITVVQPAGGGRRRLYCSNAHRAEARRRRLAASPEAPAADVLGSSLERLAGVLDDLSRHRAELAAVDPTRQAAEAARLRADTTAQVLAAQQSAAAAADDAARAGDQLEAERSERRREREEHRHEVEELLAAVATARANAAAAQDELDRALVAHGEELQRRDQLAAKAAASHEDEATGLRSEIKQARTALAEAEARAAAGDDRAARSDAQRRRAEQQAAKVEKRLGDAQVELAKARAAADAATARAGDLAARLEKAEGELQAERNRHDARFTELQDQLAQLLAQGGPARSTAARTRKPAARASAG